MSLTRREGDVSLIYWLEFTISPLVYSYAEIPGLPPAVKHAHFPPLR